MKEEISKFFKGVIKDDEETLSLYSHDASLLEVKPKIVVFPKDKEDVMGLVKWAGEKKLSITARCAGTDMSGGSIGESIILDFTRYMNKLIGGPLPMDHSSVLFHPADGTPHEQNYPSVASYVSVEPGMFYRDFEKITKEKSLILPCYTASKSLNALGGMFGNNSAGERSLKYGKMENYILSSNVVFSDGNEYMVRPLNRKELEMKMAQGDFEGNVYKNIFNLIKENKEEIERAKPKVSKNSSGYYIWNVVKNWGKENFSFDLNKLLVGSQGTLGIVTEMTLKIVPDIKHSKLAVIFMKDLKLLGRLVDEILSTNPETIETYDDKTLKLAVRFFPDFLKNKGFIGMFKFLWSFIPEFFMFLKGIFGGLPELIVLVEYSGKNEKELDEKCKNLLKKIKDFNLRVHITETEIEANKYWDIRRESFSLLRKHIKGKRTAPFIDDIIVRPELLPKFLTELNNILKKYDLTYTLAGHAGNGNFHIIPLMDFKKADTAKIILELGEKVYDLVAKYHGSITAEHNDGLIRTPYLSKIYENHTIEIFKKIKNIFDPDNIFNPGKKVPVLEGGGTKKYLMAHIIKK